VVTSPGDSAQAGKAARARAPRSSHAHWQPPADRFDPVALLSEEASVRVPELVPIRHQRMAGSAFAFFRGAAALMAADLADTPVSGLRAQLCGDAHLANFGAFASPDRRLVFDLNDFDETLEGPWEWDVKRLVTSVVVACEDRGWGRRRQADLARRTARAYREAMRQFAGMRALDVWYARIDEQRLADALRERGSAGATRRFERNAKRARAKDSSRAFEKLAYRQNGTARIAADPPLITPVEDLAAPADADAINEMMSALVARYAETLPLDRGRLVARYRYAHAARKVVGVGSVGTRAWVLLLIGRDHSDPLFLQAKEAEPSVLEQYAGASPFENQGRRVVEGQRLIQGASDILLGWLRAEGVDGKERDFYVRQLWDWKASADMDRITGPTLALYLELCAWTLARAHARTGDPAAIAAYLGSSERFDEALAVFARTYADQNASDYRAFVEAIAAGRIEAAEPVPSPA
jgi:uncharacterized protein (DUF2252 family)